MSRQTPNINKNVTPYIVADPIGIDVPVKALQAQFAASLAWLTKSFARSTIRSNINGEGTTQIFPVCWVEEKKDEFIMIGNDNWNAYSFMVARGTETPIDYNPFDDNRYQRELSIYFWFKLDEIDDAKGTELLEELKQEILNAVVATQTNSEFELTGIEDDPSVIYNGFTFSDETITQRLYYPNGALRFDFNVSYDGVEICN